jgi:hypothetical protein
LVVCCIGTVFVKMTVVTKIVGKLQRACCIITCMLH